MTPDEFTAFLDDISDAFMRPDYALWDRRIRLPFTLVTATGPVTLTTRAEVRKNYDHYMEACRILHLTEVVRDPVKIEECADGTVLGTYRTHLISGGSRTRDPYTSTALLHPDVGMWRMSAVLNALGHHHWTGQAPLISGENHD